MMLLLGVHASTETLLTKVLRIRLQTEAPRVAAKITYTRLESVSEFGGCWKHQNSPACTNRVRGFRVLKLETIGKKDYTVEKEFIGFLTSCQPRRVTSV